MPKRCHPNNIVQHISKLKIKGEKEGKKKERNRQRKKNEEKEKEIENECQALNDPNHRFLKRKSFLPKHGKGYRKSAREKEKENKNVE